MKRDRHEWRKRRRKEDAVTPSPHCALRRQYSSLGLPWPLLLLLLALCLPFPTVVHSACVLTGECKKGAITPLVNYSIPCVEETPREPFTLATSDAQKLRAFCPHLFDGDGSVCCTGEQVKGLIDKLSLLLPLMSTCKIAMMNFNRVWCDLTCSPHQSSFLRVLKVTSDKEQGESVSEQLYVERLQFHSSKQFMEEMLRSAHRTTFYGAPAMVTICGMPEECAKRFDPRICLKPCLEFLGKKDLMNQIPINIDFELHSDAELPPVGISLVHKGSTAHACNRPPTSDMDACPCDACKESCQAGSATPPWLLDFVEQYAEKEPEKTVYSRDPTVANISGEPTSSPLPTFSSSRRCLLGYKCIYVYTYAFAAFMTFILLLVGFYWLYWSEKHEKEDELKPRKPRFGKFRAARNWLDDRQSFLAKWYTDFMLAYHYRVLLVSCSCVLLCSLGLLRINLVSDPIDVWTSPDSRSRIEKAYFDDHFGELPRYAQVILSPTNVAPFHYGKEWFGPAFNSVFFLHSMRLIRDLLNVTTTVSVNGSERVLTLSDVCLKPWGEERGCFILSPFGFFQNDWATLKRVMGVMASEKGRGGQGEETEEEDEYDWSDEEEGDWAVEDGEDGDIHEDTVRAIPVKKNSSEWEETQEGWMPRVAEIELNGVKKKITRHKRNTDDDDIWMTADEMSEMKGGDTNEATADPSQLVPFGNEMDARADRLKNIVTLFSFMKMCINNPTHVFSKENLSCLAHYGGPQLPDMVFGGWAPQHNPGAASLGSRAQMMQNLGRDHLITIALDPTKAKWAEAYEIAFLEKMKSFHSAEMTAVFVTQRSIRDEIDRAALTDVNIALIGNLLVNSYFVFTLAQHRRGSTSPLAMLASIKLVVGITGAATVLMAIISVMGFYAWINVHPTLMCLEVQPFLIAAIGVNNILHVVKTYQRLCLSMTGQKGERRDRLATTFSIVLPSMFASAIAECSCFLTVGFSRIPALQVFSLFASAGVFANFLLTLTIFVPVFVADTAREEEGKSDLLCCCANPKTVRNLRREKGIFHRLFENYIANTVTNYWVRVCALTLQYLMLTVSIFLALQLKVGLDEKHSVPADSYVRAFMESYHESLALGLPVHFVVKGPLDMNRFETQKLFCNSAGCSDQSLGALINSAIQHTSRRYLLTPVVSWLDDYLSWMRPGSNCCRFRSDIPGVYCSETDEDSECVPCMSVNGSGQHTVYSAERPTNREFYAHLAHFTRQMPTMKCPNGGAMAHYNSFLTAGLNNSVQSFFYRAFHPTFNTSEGFINGLRLTRLISEEFNRVLKANGIAAEVLPYSYYYPYYDQYTEIAASSVQQMGLSVGIAFLALAVSLVNPHLSFIVTANTCSCTMQIIAYMYLMGIELNALTLVNLAMSLGILLEFMVHVVYVYSQSGNPDRQERAKEALVNVGSTVLCGIVAGKTLGLMVLAFSAAVIFRKYYFLFYVGLVPLGTLHGLLFLPAQLCFFGPSLYQRRYEEKQREEREGRDAEEGGGDRSAASEAGSKAASPVSPPSTATAVLPSLALAETPSARASPSTLMTTASARTARSGREREESIPLMPVSLAMQEETEDDAE